ncbi:hypothetical protein GCM10009560_34860 [Nonomuraea longicatena]|uniref:RNA polymerase sigma-70 region 2 domain-containing protein n=1 Tax=Nonomuraea longicatena TaxID=83682 RepID=A0ABN1PMG3_9ACTN
MTERGDRTVEATKPSDGGTGVDGATEAFVAHRNLLFTVAYEMLGTAADAENVLQETWMRWVNVALDIVEDPRAYLVRITGRLRRYRDGCAALAAGPSSQRGRALLQPAQAVPWPGHPLRQDRVLLRGHGHDRLDSPLAVII